MFADATQHHQARRPVEAGHRYRQILAVKPDHADSLHSLGIAAFQSGHFDLAIELIGKAVAVEPDYPDALNTLGNALIGCSRPDDAVASYRKALDLRPNYPEAHMNLGHALWQQGKLDEAAASYRGSRLQAGLRRGLGQSRQHSGDLGEPDEAIVRYRKALVFEPSFPDVHNSLGVTLYSLGRLDEAIATYRRALEIKPDFVMALNNLASTLIAQGKPAAALDVAKRSLQIEESNDAKGILVSCLGRMHGVADGNGLRPLMVRALSEPWGWPSDLTRVCIDLPLDHDIAGCVARAAGVFGHCRGNPVRRQRPAAVAADPLLSALLDAAPMGDVEMGVSDDGAARPVWELLRDDRVR
jgi:Flp pilus assembly protein TadD